jgi:hypothetical protein
MGVFGFCSDTVLLGFEPSGEGSQLKSYALRDDSCTPACAKLNEK